jgi:asparagine synthase (glutamine-hydrolysing)
MCGIAGVVNVDGRSADPARLRAMQEMLAHRGPDGFGVHVDGPVGLAHRRLAIIDLATGAQPMESSGGGTWITFNGEIYNFAELRGDLEAHGHRFRTTSDTEVILAAYEQWGEAAVGRLRGMFAFAIWDGRQRRLLLARDRVGIKPLVYAWDGRRLLFASEVKALLSDPGLARDVDWPALGEYLAYLYVPAPRTIFRAIRKLPPACILSLDLGGGEPQVRRYWDLEFRPDPARNWERWLEELRFQLEDAVRSHLVSDVPVGAFLSGGMDSSSVVALMAQASARPVRTFSIGFDEADFDELHYARQVAARYGTAHHEFVVKPDGLEALPRLAWQFDEPFGDASAVPTYYVSRMTREHVKVVLSGDGGDENFAGYRRYARARVLRNRLNRLPGSLVRPALRLASRLLPSDARGQGYLELLAADPIERYFRMMTYHRATVLGTVLTRDLRQRMGPAPSAEGFRALARDAGLSEYVSTLQYLDIRTYLPDDILTKVDRASMLVSLEARVPLLDHRLMEFVATMPAGLKLDGEGGKAIFKAAMRSDLPAAIRSRRKMGFGVPLARWFRHELSDYTRDLLLSPRAAARGWFEPRAVAALLDAHGAGRDRSSQIWALLCLEQWARCWVD